MTFAMGDAFAEGDACELPVHEVRLTSFEVDAPTVTDDEFATFVAATGYVTDAEHRVKACRTHVGGAQQHQKP